MCHKCFSWFRCGICQYPILFDLETLFNHLRKYHQIKVKEYIELYIGPIGSLQQKIDPKPKLDSDGAPVMVKSEPKPTSKPKMRPGPASVKRLQNPNWMPDPPEKKKKIKRESSPNWGTGKTRVLSGRMSDPSTFNTGIPGVHIKFKQSCKQIGPPQLWSPCIHQGKAKQRHWFPRWIQVDQS